ncbi:aldo/keto reductase [Williamwhitmania taraxaci]|uniref:Predicted oxidoreductase n=1 Tax=Williamwhitmania taraxaci TaxID=1640674 RepID=A0A1G6NX48_9BACT|nr:aldo/keto reductase [Williamwhitmania taraxaci]SDC71914.1 Predicted oxidoreductase [Williamwhitmania taraxaci]
MNPIKSKSLIYGCMGLGGGWNQNSITAADERVAEMAIEAAMEIGISIFDHADIYTYGKAEEVFGRILKRRPSLRSEMVLQSKVGICRGANPGDSSIYNLSKTYIIAQVEGILRRLQTDQLDILLLHRPDALLVAEEVAETFDHLKQQGKVKQFGVSNMSVSQVRNLQRCCTDPLVANQLQLSLGHTLMLDLGVAVNTRLVAVDSGMQGVLEYCQETGMTIQTWSSLDKGLYTETPHSQLTDKQQETSKIVAALAEKYSTTPASIVLAWLMMIPMNIHPIIGSTKPSRILACKDASSINITREEWYGLWISARGEKLP